MKTRRGEDILGKRKRKESFLLNLNREKQNNGIIIKNKRGRTTFDRHKGGKKGGNILKEPAVFISTTRKGEG